jgi:glucose dehydrogenase
VTYCPGGLGQWNGPAYAAPSDLLFVGSADRCDTILAVATPPSFTPGTMDFGARLMTKPQEPASGWVRAVDAQTGGQKWVYHASTPIVAAMTPTAGGLLLTGDLDGDFLVFDALTGRVLYRFMTGGGIAGGVTTYEAGGRQYIAVPSGSSSRGTWGSTGSATLILFALP